MKTLKWVRRKTAKGQTYYYFDTGLKKANGKPLLTRLPDIRDPRFGASHGRAVAARTSRGKKSSALTLDGLIRLYEKSPEYHRLSASTKRSYGIYLGRANQLIRSASGESPPAASLTPKDVTAMRNRMAGTTGAASQTVRAMGALYSWATAPSQGYATLNPARGVTKYESKDHEPWPDDLLDEALADPQVGLAVALFYFTGQRINEVVKMTRNDINGDHMRVYVQKTGSDLKIAILPELAEMLDRLGGNGLTILLNANGQPWSQSGLRQKLQAWAKERGHHVVPHGLRKNAVNSLFEAGCTAAEVSGITDQSIGMLEHYAKGRNKLKLGQAAVTKLGVARAARNITGTGKLK